MFFTNIFGASSSSAASAAEHVHETDIDLRDDEILESDRTDETDDSPELLRRIRVVGSRLGSSSSLSQDAEMRRQWRIFGISQARAKASWLTGSRR
jgi:hypothetical protein